MYGRCIKRLIDISGSLSALILLLPIMGIIAMMIRKKLGDPVLFKQLRPGLHGKPFTIYKFRTMIDARDKNGALLPDEDRLTVFGRFLRSTSLDELPELFNVIKGDMSLVGPRPLLIRYLDRYSPEQARRHNVKPGITGWAQVNGRNDIAWIEKFKLDVWYVDNWSLRLDLKILVRTVFIVLRRDGISKKGYATTVSFKGNRNE
jgi:lipopolysaccharide/colanic/teichoic acid biosynthesis glycosyltransferase